LHDGITIGANLFYIQGKIAYSHLSAFDPTGYNLYAPYAVKGKAIDFFSDKVQWLNLGAGAGLINNTQDGLSKFKQGWSTDTRTAYLCGRIFNKGKYWEIVKAKKISNTGYFPTYRNEEFL
jgi:lipid II:glycine glycyltransferase (peptidoglycan interpeptide bridge formation enzyme)